MWYRINEIRRWHDALNGVNREAWMYDRDYLKTALRIEEDLSEGQVESLNRIDWGGMIPDFPQPRLYTKHSVK